MKGDSGLGVQRARLHEQNGRLHRRHPYANFRSLQPAQSALVTQRKRRQTEDGDLRMEVER